LACSTTVTGYGNSTARAASALPSVEPSTTTISSTGHGVSSRASERMLSTSTSRRSYVGTTMLNR